MTNRTTHFSGPVDSKNGFSVDGTTIIDSNGAIQGDIQATAGSIGSAELADNTIKTASVTLTADEIVGTDAGDIGHASGAELVAAPGSGKVIEFISAVFAYTYDTAAYTGGGDDNVVQLGTTAVSKAIAGADLLEASANKVAWVSALSDADVALATNTALNFHGTALTQPGTAAGTLTVEVTYRIHDIGADFDAE
jgi:hypothetical protein